MPRLKMLNGIRIIDLTQAHAGPFASQLLGDLGAEIIKIEPPLRGDLTRDNWPQVAGQSFYILALNRNKKSVVLDLSGKLGREAIHELIKHSDVVFDNFRTGVLSRLELDYDTIKKINPRIISCSIVGYGSSGPYTNRPSYDDLAQGISGMSSLCGDPGQKPKRAPVAIADIGAGLHAAVAIPAAVYQRERTGKGCRIEIDLLSTCLSLMATHWQLYFISGRVEPQGSRHPSVPLLGIYETKNGYIALGPSWPRIARAVNKDWMIDDPRFATPKDRVEHRDELEAIIGEALKQVNTEDWLELMTVEDIAAAPVNTLDKALEDPQIVHNQSIIKVMHPTCGEVKVIDCAIKSPDKAKDEHLSPPRLGEHTKEVLANILGYSSERIDQIEQEPLTHLEQLQSHITRKL